MSDRPDRVAAPYALAPLLLGLLLTGCAKEQYVEIAVPQPPKAQSALATVPPARVTVPVPTDLRSTNRLLGTTTSLFNVKMWDGFASRDVAEPVRDAFINELRAAGREVVDSGGVEVRITLHRFDYHTEVTPAYWDVIANLDVEVSVAGVTHRYASEKRRREWVNPTRKMVGDLLGECLADVTARFRADPVVGAALRAHETPPIIPAAAPRSPTR